MRFKRIGHSACAMVLLAAISGCGLDGQEPAQEGLGELRVLTAEQVREGGPAGSPERTALAWWRALQTRDVNLVRQLYIPGARRSLSNQIDSGIINLVAPRAAHSGIEINEVEQTGPAATTVQTALESANPLLDGALAIPMERVRGRWLLSDATFLTVLIDGLQGQTGQAQPATGG